MQEMDTDLGALAAGYATLTPIHYDLTRYDQLETLKHLVEQQL
jgi:5'-nucleotidase